MRGRGGRQERHPRSHEHTGHSARQIHLGGSCSGLWSGDTEVCLFHEGHNHKLQERIDHRVRVPARHPGKAPNYRGPAGSLTTALQPRVSPVELLALGTGSPTEAGMAVALPCELEWKWSRGQSLNQTVSL